MSLRTAVLYLEAETRSAFLLLSVWEVPRESRVLGPAVFYVLQGMWGFLEDLRQALESGVQSAHGTYSRRDRPRCWARTQAPALRQGCGQKRYQHLAPTAEVLERQLPFSPLPNRKCHLAYSGRMK